MRFRLGGWPELWTAPWTAMPLDGDGGTGEPAAVLTGSYGRLRHAAVAADGVLWVLTSNRDGRGDPAADDRVLRFPRA